jgi:hypothetical protein
MPFHVTETENYTTLKWSKQSLAHKTILASMQTRVKEHVSTSFQYKFCDMRTLTFKAEKYN